MINYKTQLDIRIQQIVKIEVSPPGDGGGNGNLHDLTISITIAEDPITRGNVQTITVTVSDSKSNEKIEGAIVKVSVKYASGKHTEELGSKTTDSSGRASFSWRIGGGSEPGMFTATVEVSASGYKPASKTTTFGVVAKNDNATLPIANNTIVNDTSRVIVNNTDINGNETGPSDGEQGDAGSDNGNVTLLLPPPDPCIENPSLPECTLPEPLPLCDEDPTAEGCEAPPPPPPPQVEPEVEEEETADEEEVEGATELTEDDDDDDDEEESEDVDDEEEEVKQNQNQNQKNLAATKKNRAIQNQKTRKVAAKESSSIGIHL